MELTMPQGIAHPRITCEECGKRLPPPTLEEEIEHAIDLSHDVGSQYVILPDSAEASELRDWLQ